MDRYSVYDDLLEGVQLISHELVYLYVNDTAAIQFRRSVEELIGNSITRVFPAIEKTDLFPFLILCLGKTSKREVINIHEYKDCHGLYFELKIKPVKEGVLIFSRDITQQKKMELKLQSLSLETEKKIILRTQLLSDALDKAVVLNDVKSKFIDMASHEFKSPLGTIQLMVDILETYNAPEFEEERKKYYHNIKSSVNSLFNIINDFLTYEQLEAIQINWEESPYALKDFVHSEIERIKVYCKNNQVIKYTHAGGELIRQDKRIIRCIVTNLLSNALKYSKRDVELTTQVNSKNTVLKFEDKGIGIPLSDQRNIFSKFYRASNVDNIEGTGLGLNIVKRYVEILEGQINFKSQPGNGTSFSIILPNTVSLQNEGH